MIQRVKENCELDANLCLPKPFVFPGRRDHLFPAVKGNDGKVSTNEENPPPVKERTLNSDLFPQQERISK